MQSLDPSSQQSQEKARSGLQEQINEAFEEDFETSKNQQQQQQLQGSPNNPNMAYNPADYQDNQNQNQEIFSLFDLDGSGKIDINDLEEIGKAMGWKKQEVNDLIYSLDPNHDGKISFEEFELVMKYIEERLEQKTSPVGQNPSQQTLGQQSKMIGDSQHRMYGALLPKTGVYFLPDEKIIGFLKIMNELRKKYEREGNYQKAKLLKYKFDSLSNQEARRQEVNMRMAQEQELVTVENAQKMQFTEFAEAWDKYMSDYETAAFESVEKLKEKHIREIQDLHEKVRKDFNLKFKWSRELLELRSQEKIHFTVKDYTKAEECKRLADKLEIEEKAQSENQLAEAIMRQEKILRQKQQMGLASLLKRIQRDREEQMKHRQEDSQRLMQRNTNLLKDMMSKQQQEQRKTAQFLKFALGKRENKTDEEYKQMMKQSAYQPSSDPLMGRLNRKYNNPQTSQQSQMSKAVRLSTQDSRTSKTMHGSFMKQSYQFQSPNSLINQQRNQSVKYQQINSRRVNQSAILEEVNGAVNQINSFRGPNQDLNMMQEKRLVLPKIQ